MGTYHTSSHETALAPGGTSSVVNPATGMDWRHLTPPTYSNKYPLVFRSTSTNDMYMSPIRRQNFLGICSTTGEFSSNWDEENLLPRDFHKTVENPSILGSALFNYYYYLCTYLLSYTCFYNTFTHNLHLFITSIPFILIIIFSCNLFIHLYYYISCYVLLLTLKKKDKFYVTYY